MFVHLLKIHTYLVNGFDTVTESGWYVRVYHCVFYIAMLVTAGGMLRPEATKSLTRRVFL